MAFNKVELIENVTPLDKKLFEHLQNGIAANAKKLDGTYKELDQSSVLYDFLAADEIFGDPITFVEYSYEAEVGKPDTYCRYLGRAKDRDGYVNGFRFLDAKHIRIVTVWFKNGDSAQELEFTPIDNSVIPQVKPEFANSLADLEESGDTTKVYVLPDGEIYGFIRKAGTPPEITIESRNDGYWSVGSSFDIRFQTVGGMSAKKTNKIPVTPGDKLSYMGVMKYATNKSVVWSNASGTPISGEQISSLNSATIVTAPTNAAFAEFLSFNESATVPATLVVEWVLCQAAAPTYRWASTGILFVATGLEDRVIALENKANSTVSVLKGKKIVYDGDSIAESRTSGTAANGGGYAKIIADKVGGTYINQAVGGAYLRSTTVSGKHSVADNLANLPKDGDLYCFEGGINDYWNNATLGTFSKTDFTGTLDATTVCGALETIFRYALTNFIGKPICFVITHKIQSTAYNKNNSSGNTFEEYRNAMVGICEKYSIPYYDAFSESGLNGWNTVQNNAYLTANANGTADGTHPNADGYKRYYVPQLISLFERIMPV